MTRDELREKVARSIALKVCGDDDLFWRDYLAEADAAMAVIGEACAKAAEHEAMGSSYKLIPRILDRIRTMTGAPKP